MGGCWYRTLTAGDISTGTVLIQNQNGNPGPTVISMVTFTGDAALRSSNAVRHLPPSAVPTTVTLNIQPLATGDRVLYVGMANSALSTLSMSMGTQIQQVAGSLGLFASTVPSGMTSADPVFTHTDTSGGVIDIVIVIRSP